MAKTNELAELKALVAEQKKQLKALEKKAAENSETKNADELAELKALVAEQKKQLKNSETKSAKGILLQMIDKDKKPMNNYVHYDTEQEKYLVRLGREFAHHFTAHEAKEFLSEPGREHFIKV